MTTEAEFQQAVADSKNLPQRPDSATLLTLYSLYKQAVSGDAAGERPGAADFINRAKWDAWEKLKGIPHTEAMVRYTALINDLKSDG